MILRQTLARAVDGYWDDGPKQVFDWTIDWVEHGHARVESWEANHFFTVAEGKTVKQTLSYAKKHLQASTRIPSTFEYITKGGK